jgi:hypothetical protein
LTLRDVTRCARTASVKISLQVGLGQRHTRRAAIHNSTNGWAMGLTKGCDGEQQTESIAGHGKPAITRIEKGALDAIVPGSRPSG